MLSSLTAHEYQWPSLQPLAIAIIHDPVASVQQWQVIKKQPIMSIISISIHFHMHCKVTAGITGITAVF